jgi:hypothetical protein
VDVRRRPAARRYERLHDEVGAAGLLARDEEGVVVARPPESGAALGRTVEQCRAAVIRECYALHQSYLA